MLQVEERVKSSIVAESSSTLLLDQISVTRYLGLLQVRDFSFVKEHALKRGVFSEGEVDKYFEEYTRWLALTLAHPETLVPISPRVDDVWHAHILFTEDYADMCHAVAGEFIHHRPGVLPSDDDWRTPDTGMYLYRQAFGEPDLRIWPLRVTAKCADPCSRWKPPCKSHKH